MILTFICFLLLAGGNVSSLESQDLHHDQQKFNQSFAEMLDANTTSNELSHAGNQTSNQSSEQKTKTCSYLDVLNYLNFTQNKDNYTLTRPVKDHRHKTEVYISMVIYAILDVSVTDQTFIVYVWIVMGWSNEFTQWNREDFCGIKSVEVPKETLWQPDITIVEMIEKDKAPPSPFLEMYDDGWVYYKNDQVVISTCKMEVYKFPFDVQSCSLSFKSVLHSDDKLDVNTYKNSDALTMWSRRIMESQYEWEFLKQNATSETVNYFGRQTVIIFTITMQRKSTLYVTNFLLPVLFFLCLDFASLMMSNSGGEKIGFKITVLLAVTVMQLILNEILPFTSRSLPLIVIYCVGTFALMLLSLLEAVFIKYLVDKDVTFQDNKGDSDLSLKEEREIKNGASICDEMGDQTSSIYKEGSSSQLTEIFLAVEKVSDELEKMKKASLFSNKNEDVEPGYWTKLADKINKVFAICYITAVFVFLCTLFSLWTSD